MNYIPSFPRFPPPPILRQILLKLPQLASGSSCLSLLAGVSPALKLFLLSDSQKYYFCVCVGGGVFQDRVPLCIALAVLEVAL